MGQCGGREGGRGGWRGAGLVLSWIRHGRGKRGAGRGGGGRWVGGPGQKTSNLSPCPVPLVVKLNARCRGGSVETNAYLAEFGSEWTDGFEGIRLEGLKLALVQNYKSTQLSSS